MACQGAEGAASEGSGSCCIVHHSALLWYHPNMANILLDDSVAAALCASSCCPGPDCRTVFGGPVALEAAVPATCASVAGRSRPNARRRGYSRLFADRVIFTSRPLWRPRLMTCLIDTGILLRAFDASFAEYRLVRQALRSLLASQDRLIVALQNLAEFWNVSTRPVDKNGYGISVERASRRLNLIEQICEVVTEDDRSSRIWKGLPMSYAITGVSVHDARLVSVMLSQGVSTILTLNERDFRRYSGISILTLDRFANGSSPTG